MPTSTRCEFPGRLEPAPGVFLSLRAVERACATPPSPLRTTSPGLEIVLARAWTLPEGRRLEVFCGEIMPPLWMPGFESAVLNAAGALVHKLSDMDHYLAGAFSRHERSFGQAYALESEGERGAGMHLAAFEQDGTLLVCSALCTGPEREAAACEHQVSSANLGGELAEAPAPGLLITALSAALESPRQAGLGALFLAIVAVVAILRMRPR